ncbi:uncharacterized protein L969DRAFT_96442 [Mixia osmundae IAM 14324]|uniref:SAP domain-containing protein n=1 Tax=Mixia osmundae (strain CBS 9802 / IAM 14324 / JCM 22182 / KY 12970) TaxID=764103 RepID=G7DWK2_MIXOS|nr:uncharacterized protein L969DRAFT_96442 [Mixia osmundae IAM 14324]KEI37363.1 hypothetical protein L969DRAFT_96442 [Mixia osmundae IAM 14324]GAA94962.1 hypothetical protein E5Q_01617 [Mixia osmundae IAM 14324]
MTDEASLSKLKVAELKEQLSALSLPTTGVKAELVARLAAHHAEASSKSVPATSTVASASPDKPEAKKETAAATEPASVATEPPKPAALSEEEKQARIDAELAARKARAARFGLPEPEADALKARAERFGTAKASADGGESKSVSQIDEALAGGRKRKAGQGKAATNGEATKTEGPAKDAKKVKKQEAKPVSSTTEAKKPAYVPDAAELEKMRKRAERFGTEEKVNVSA